MMKVLLCKNIEKLGIVGDVVTVKPGYARNYLLPHHLATEPTERNMRALAEARRVAEEERERKRTELERLAEKVRGFEVTLHARANEDGVLYGSVGARDIADALAEDDFFVKPEQVLLDRPIRQLDSVSVDLRFADDLRSTIKVWVVRDKSADADAEDGESEGRDSEGREESGGREESAGQLDDAPRVGTEAGGHDHSGNE